MQGSRLLPAIGWLRSCDIRDVLGEGRRESVWKQGSILSPWLCPEVAQSPSCSEAVLPSIVSSSCLHTGELTRSWFGIIFSDGLPRYSRFQPARGVELAKEQETSVGRTSYSSSACMWPEIFLPGHPCSPRPFPAPAIAKPMSRLLGVAEQQQHPGHCHNCHPPAG